MEEKRIERVPRGKSNITTYNGREKRGGRNRLTMIDVRQLKNRPGAGETDDDSDVRDLPIGRTPYDDHSFGST